MKRYKLYIIFLLCYVVFFCVSFYGGSSYYDYANNKTVLTSFKPVQTDAEARTDNYRSNKNDEKSENNKGNKFDNINEAPRNVVQDKELYPKEVFLTFDDGPSKNNTEKIIAILNQNNIKATFFVIGKNAEVHPEVLRELKQNGMAVATHTYTHDYKIYKSKESFFDDLRQCNDTIKNITGERPIRYIRLPGGSDNKVSDPIVMKDIRDTLKQMDIPYVDWNVSSGDADSKLVSASKIKSNLLTQFNNRKFAVVLIHDAPAKTTSVEALPEVIKYLKDQGYVFRTFYDITPTEENEMIKRRIIYR